MMPDQRTTGQRIGNVVKAAITTAFPAVSTVLDSIMKATPNSSDKKVSTSDVKKATTDTLTATDKATQAKAQAAIAPVGQVGAELATVNLFLSPSVEANNNVLQMQVQILATAPDWDAIATNWQVAKAQLDKISKVQDSDINKVQDLYLRNKLTDIRAANSDLVIRIDAAVKAKKSPQAAPLLTQLNTILGGMPAVAGYELANLQGDLASLAEWAKGAAGNKTTPPSSIEVYTTSLQSIPSTR